MEQILREQKELAQHPVYYTFTSMDSIKHFMRYHVFAVWDFMSLLKSLQRQISCIDVPWKPSVFPAKMVRLINQIVLGEESDIDQFGNPTSHFELYLKAMEEVGASTSEISDFINSLDMSIIPIGARRFVEHNLFLAKHGHIVEVAASFFYGREKLVPDMFKTMKSILKKENIHAPTLIYYLERHIEVDSGEHGPLALECLDFLIGNDKALRSLAYHAGEKALLMREELWNEVLLSGKINSTSK